MENYENILSLLESTSSRDVGVMMLAGETHSVDSWDIIAKSKFLNTYQSLSLLEQIHANAHISQEFWNSFATNAEELDEIRLSEIKVQYINGVLGKLQSVKAIKNLMGWGLKDSKVYFDKNILPYKK